MRTRPETSAPIHGLSATEAARFERAISSRTSAHDRAICRLLLHAGLRASEVVALDVHHIDLTAGEVHVPQVKSPARTVPITDQATLTDLAAVVEARDPKTDTAQPLFVSTTGGRLRTSRVLWLVREVSTKTGLEARPATLRRTYAARLQREELEAEEIAERMGWSLTVTA